MGIMSLSGMTVLLLSSIISMTVVWIASVIENGLCDNINEIIMTCFF